MPWTTMHRQEGQVEWRHGRGRGYCENATVEVRTWARAGRAAEARDILRGLQRRGWVRGRADCGRNRRFPFDHPGRLSGETRCYVGRKDCGCVVAACVDNPEHRRDTARFVADIIKDGLTVETMTVKEVRRCLTVCKHSPRKPQALELPGILT